MFSSKSSAVLKQVARVGRPSMFTKGLHSTRQANSSRGLMAVTGGIAAASATVFAFTVAPALAEGESATEAPAPDLGEILASTEEEATEAPTVGKRKRRRRRRVRDLPNPGPLDEANLQSMEVLSTQANFAGGKFEVNYTPIQRQNKLMSFQFGAHMDPASFRDGKEICYAVSVQNETGMMMAKFDNTYALYGRAQQQLTDKITGAFTTNILGDNQVVVLELDYKGKDFCSKAKYMNNPDGNTLTGQYHQSVTQNTSLGVELVHQLETQTALNFTGRWAKLRNKKKEGDFAVVTLSTQGAIVGNYTKQICQQVLLSSSLTIAPDPRSKTFPLASAVGVGALYRYNSFRYNGVMKTTGDVAVNLDYMMAPGMTFAFSGLLNHFTNDSKFGVGMRVGG